MVFRQALEEGEDLQELADRMREKHARRANRLMSAPDTPNRSTPVSDVEGRGRKGKKNKGKMTPPDYEPLSIIKRKRGPKSMSVTPSINDNDDDDDDRDMVCTLDSFSTIPLLMRWLCRNGARPNRFQLTTYRPLSVSA